jgi:hypothetical protein
VLGLVAELTAGPDPRRAVDADSRRGADADSRRGADPGVCRAVDAEARRGLVAVVAVWAAAGPFRVLFFVVAIYSLTRDVIGVFDRIVSNTRL